KIGDHLQLSLSFRCSRSQPATVSGRSCHGLRIRELISLTPSFSSTYSQYLRSHLRQDKSTVPAPPSWSYWVDSRLSQPATCSKNYTTTKRRKRGNAKDGGDADIIPAKTTIDLI